MSSRKINSEETDFIREDEKLYNPYRQPTSSFWIRQSKHPKAATFPLKELKDSRSEQYLMKAKRYKKVDRDLQILRDEYIGRKRYA